MNKQPKYKICRRLGGAVFPQCENPRFAAAHAPKQRGGQKKGGRAASEYGTQLLDKQRVRFTYNLRERQFARYVREAAEKKGISPAEYLFRILESRLDNAVYRLGFAKSRAAARQMVSHGHITVDGKKVTIPSFGVRPGNIIRIRDGSKNKTLFGDVAVRLKDYTAPTWLVLDEKKTEGKVKDMPVPDTAAGDIGNLTSVLEFYGR
ncbi:MAG: 30S ribosomal protein S4 [Parcubacteria group bacterium]|nr:30S ribosomal protein S4 [Parcubacteria group bacterium]